MDDTHNANMSEVNNCSKISVGVPLRPSCSASCLDLDQVDGYQVQDKTMLNNRSSIESNLSFPSREPSLLEDLRTSLQNKTFMKSKSRRNISFDFSLSSSPGSQNNTINTSEALTAVPKGRKLNLFSKHKKKELNINFTLGNESSSSIEHDQPGDKSMDLPTASRPVFKRPKSKRVSSVKLDCDVSVSDDSKTNFDLDSILEEPAKSIIASEAVGLRSTRAGGLGKSKRAKAVIVDFTLNDSQASNGSINDSGISSLDPKKSLNTLKNTKLRSTKLSIPFTSNDDTPELNASDDELPSDSGESKSLSEEIDSPFPRMTKSSDLETADRIYIREGKQVVTKDGNLRGAICAVDDHANEGDGGSSVEMAPLVIEGDVAGVGDVDPLVPVESDYLEEMLSSTLVPEPMCSGPADSSDQRILNQEPSKELVPEGGAVDEESFACPVSEDKANEQLVKNNLASHKKNADVNPIHTEESYMSVDNDLSNNVNMDVSTITAAKTEVERLRSQRVSFELEYNGSVNNDSETSLGQSSILDESSKSLRTSKVVALRCTRSGGFGKSKGSNEQVVVDFTLSDTQASDGLTNVSLLDPKKSLNPLKTTKSKSAKFSIPFASNTPDNSELNSSDNNLHSISEQVKSISGGIGSTSPQMTKPGSIFSGTSAQNYVCEGKESVASPVAEDEANALLVKDNLPTIKEANSNSNNAEEPCVDNGSFDNISMDISKITVPKTEFKRLRSRKVSVKFNHDDSSFDDTVDQNLLNVTNSDCINDNTFTVRRTGRPLALQRTDASNKNVTVNLSLGFLDSTADQSVERASSNQTLGCGFPADGINALPTNKDEQIGHSIPENRYCLIDEGGSPDIPKPSTAVSGKPEILNHVLSKDSSKCLEEMNSANLDPVVLDKLVGSQENISYENIYEQDNQSSSAYSSKHVSLNGATLDSNKDSKTCSDNISLDVSLGRSDKSTSGSLNDPVELSHDDLVLDVSHGSKSYAGSSNSINTADHASIRKENEILNIDGTLIGTTTSSASKGVNSVAQSLSKSSLLVDSVKNENFRGSKINIPTSVDIDDHDQCNITSSLSHQGSPEVIPSNENPSMDLRRPAISLGKKSLREKGINVEFTLSDTPNSESVSRNDSVINSEMYINPLQSRGSRNKRISVPFSTQSSALNDDTSNISLQIQDSHVTDDSEPRTSHPIAIEEVNKSIPLTFSPKVSDPLMDINTVGSLPPIDASQCVVPHDPKFTKEEACSNETATSLNGAVKHSIQITSKFVSTSEKEMTKSPGAKPNHSIQDRKRKSARLSPRDATMESATLDDSIEPELEKKNRGIRGDAVSLGRKSLPVKCIDVEFTVSDTPHTETFATNDSILNSRKYVNTLKKRGSRNKRISVPFSTHSSALIDDTSNIPLQIEDSRVSDDEPTSHPIAIEDEVNKSIPLTVSPKVPDLLVVNTPGSLAPVDASQCVVHDPKRPNEEACSSTAVCNNQNGIAGLSSHVVPEIVSADKKEITKSPGSSPNILIQERKRKSARLAEGTKSDLATENNNASASLGDDEFGPVAVPVCDRIQSTSDGMNPSSENESTNGEQLCLMISSDDLNDGSLSLNSVADIGNGKLSNEVVENIPYSPQADCALLRSVTMDNSIENKLVECGKDLVKFPPRTSLVRISSPLKSSPHLLNREMVSKQNHSSPKVKEDVKRVSHEYEDIYKGVSANLLPSVLEVEEAPDMPPSPSQPCVKTREVMGSLSQAGPDPPIFDDNARQMKRSPCNLGKAAQVDGENNHGATTALDDIQNEGVATSNTDGHGAVKNSVPSSTNSRTLLSVGQAGQSVHIQCPSVPYGAEAAAAVPLSSEICIVPATEFGRESTRIHPNTDENHGVSKKIEEKVVVDIPLPPSINLETHNRQTPTGKPTNFKRKSVSFKPAHQNLYHSPPDYHYNDANKNSMASTSNSEGGGKYDEFSRIQMTSEISEIQTSVRVTRSKKHYTSTPLPESKKRRVASDSIFPKNSIDYTMRRESNPDDKLFAKPLAVTTADLVDNEFLVPPPPLFALKPDTRLSSGELSPLKPVDPAEPSPEEGKENQATGSNSSTSDKTSIDLSYEKSLNISAIPKDQTGFKVGNVFHSTPLHHAKKSKKKSRKKDVSIVPDQVINDRSVNTSRNLRSRSRQESVMSESGSSQSNDQSRRTVDDDNEERSSRLTKSAVSSQSQSGGQPDSSRGSTPQPISKESYSDSNSPNRTSMKDITVLSSQATSHSRARNYASSRNSRSSYLTRGSSYSSFDSHRKLPSRRLFTEGVPADEEKENDHAKRGTTENSSSTHVFEVPNGLAVEGPSSRYSDSRGDEGIDDHVVASKSSPRPSSSSRDDSVASSGTDSVASYIPHKSLRSQVDSLRHSSRASSVSSDGSEVSLPGHHRHLRPKNVQSTQSYVESKKPKSKFGKKTRKSNSENSIIFPKITKRKHSKKLSENYDDPAEWCRKPRKLFKPGKWASKKFYDWLELKLRTKHGLKTTLMAEKVVIDIQHVYLLVLNGHPDGALDTVRERLVDLGVCATELEFWSFIHKFMPFEFRMKVIPMGGAFGSAIAPRTLPYDEL